jgi:hypothetical protein
MSLLGFNIVINNLKASTKPMLKEMMDASKKEFEQNFETESNTETGSAWTPLSESTLLVKQNPDNGILVDTGMLKNEATEGKVIYTQNSSTLIVDPIDKYGKGYASYHMDGDGVPERDYLTRSLHLENEIEDIAMKYIDKSFV